MDLDPSDGDTSFVDEIRFMLNLSGTLTITMRSTDLDAVLLLLDRSTSCFSGCNEASARVIAFNDDSGGGVNGFDAFISMDLAADTYIIRVDSVEPQTGNYSLETTFYSLNGFNDRFLPSRKELKELYVNRLVVGSFASGYYWSSSEFNDEVASFHGLGDFGSLRGDNKFITLGVRAVRAF